MQLVYASQRYHVLETELELWGYDIIRQHQFSSWDELTGVVRIKGERQQGELRVTFSISEFWISGNVPGRWQVQGASLVRHHYHGQVGPDRRIRWCLDEERHPAVPRHIHRFEHSEEEEPDACPPITAEQALQMFEQQVFEMMQAGLLP
jgi:hypothetical protein